MLSNTTARRGAQQLLGRRSGFDHRPVRGEGAAQHGDPRVVLQRRIPSADDVVVPDLHVREVVDERLATVTRWVDVHDDDLTALDLRRKTWQPAGRYL